MRHRTFICIKTTSSSGNYIKSLAMSKPRWRSFKIRISNKCFPKALHSDSINFKSTKYIKSGSYVKTLTSVQLCNWVRIERIVFLKGGKMFQMVMSLILTKSYVRPIPSHGMTRDIGRFFLLNKKFGLISVDTTWLIFYEVMTASYWQG